MAKNDNKSNKEKKHFFRDFKAEIKKVIWPTPKQLFNNTVAIITMVLIIGAIVFVLDLVFDAANKYGLTNLQKSVQSEQISNTTNTNTTSDTSNTTTTTNSTSDNTTAVEGQTDSAETE